MTVIAWDGKTLAADKRASQSGLAFNVTKIFRVPAGLVGVEGNYDVAMHLLNWLKSGANPDKYPECQKDNERYSYMLLITPEKEILRYDREPYPYKIEEPFFAAGAGRDYAIAAMYLGKTAREAVELTCRFDISCGNGIDTLTFEEA